MKKISFVMIAALLMTTACKQEVEGKSKPAYEPATEEVTQEVTEAPKEESDDTGKFDLKSLPENNKDLGEFPYYTVPDWIKTGGYSDERESDFDIYEFYTGETFLPVEGRLSVVYFSEKQGEKWNEYKFKKTYSEHFERLGAKKIWEGEKEKSYPAASIIAEKKGDSYIYKSTTQGLQENQTIYALKNNENILFIAVAANSAFGSIVVMQAGEFVQTVDVLKPEQNQSEAAEK